MRTYCKKSLFVIILFIISLLTIKIQAQKESEYKLSEVIVTASKTPVVFSSLSRSVFLITPAELEIFPVNTVQDMLKYVPGIDVRTRGPEGVQSDVGIRGGSFEQTLVLIDGIKISDPQTGHHNMNLPLPYSAVERIEILKGQGSRIYGANAFSGAINIITKKPKEPVLDLSLTGGQNSLFGASLAGAYSIGSLNSFISFSKDKSDGYRSNTNFDILNFFYNSSYSFSSGSVFLTAGYNDKKFGANNFYSDKYPNQWEHTTTRIAALSAKFDLDYINLSPKLYWRRNDDDYILDNSRPDWYRNIHKTNSFGGELQADFTSPLGPASFGGELTYDKIESANLGNHNRTKGGFFAEQNISLIKGLTISGGFFLYNYSGFGWKLWPGADLGCLLNDNVKIFASAGKAFRIPTFTELYYTSPANNGNPSLLPEETINYELGASFFNKAFQLNGSLFYKKGRNIIDWVRSSSDAVWIVKNETELNTAGFEAGLIFFPRSFLTGIPVKMVSLNYTYLSMDRSAGEFESKYSLEHLRHQFTAILNSILPMEISLTFTMRYIDRESYGDYFIADAGIEKHFSSISAFLNCGNLFNESYMDIGGIPMPGRWISGGLRIKWE